MKGAKRLLPSSYMPLGAVTACKATKLLSWPVIIEISPPPPGKTFVQKFSEAHQVVYVLIFYKFDLIYLNNYCASFICHYLVRNPTLTWLLGKAQCDVSSQAQGKRFNNLLAIFIDEVRILFNFITFFVVIVFLRGERCNYFIFIIWCFYNRPYCSDCALPVKFTDEKSFIISPALVTYSDYLFHSKRAKGIIKF